MEDEMTTDREQIIAAAKEAGIKLTPFVVDDEEYDFCEVEMDDDENLERFYAIAFEAGRQAEREDCAKAVEQGTLGGKWCGDIIRERSTK